jgi:hypothetical protein
MKYLLLFQHPVTKTYFQVSEPFSCEVENNVLTIPYNKVNKVVLVKDNGLYVSGKIYDKYVRDLDIVKQKDNDVVLSCQIMEEVPGGRTMTICVCEADSKNIQKITRYDY